MLQPAVMSSSTVLLVLGLVVSGVIGAGLALMVDERERERERESHSSSFCICFPHTGLQMGHFLQSTGRDCVIFDKNSTIGNP